MKLRAAVLLALSGLAFPIAAPSPGAAQSGSPPAPGDKAPLFSLPGSDGRLYRLADYHGKQVVVLAWFARAFSGG